VKPPCDPHPKPNYRPKPATMQHPPPQRLALCAGHVQQLGGASPLPDL